MKLNLYHILFSFLALFLTQTSLLAQDAPGYNHPNSYEHDASTYTYGDSEAKSVSPVKSNAATIARDSSSAVRNQPVQRVKQAVPEGKDAKPAQVQPAPQQPASSGQGNSEDDSILSFNFLYYIIQKFKMQDIIE